MRYPSPAYRPPETEEKHWDRWNRRPRPSQRYPAHYARAPRIPSSSISSGPSISRDPNVRIPSKVSSKTLVPESSTPSCRADSKGRQSGNSIVGSKERYSSKSSDTRLVSPDLRTPSAKFHAPESSPHSSATLPSTPESEAPPDQVEVALSKLSVADEESQTKFQRIVDGIKWLLLDQWFLLVFALLVIIASQKQVSTPAAQQIKQTITSYLCVSVIFFITGCTLPTKILVENYKRWKVHLVVQGQGFLMTSAVTFGIVCALNKSSIFDPYAGFKNRPKDPTPSWLLVGMLFMGCVPTSISSNVVLTEQAHGNMAFTVVQSTIGNFMAPFLTPLLMNMYTGPTSPFPLGSAIPQRDNYAMLYGRVFKQLGLSVFLPMILGQIVQNLFPDKTKLVLKKWKFSKLSSISLLVILWQTVDQAFWAQNYYHNLSPALIIKPSQIAILCIICPALFLFWLAIAFATFIRWLPRGDTIAACYCIPAKTPSLGVPLSTAMYVGLSAPQQSSIQIPLVIFQGLQIVVGSLLTLGFRRWIAAHEKKRKRAASRHVSCYSGVVADGDVEKGGEPISEEDQEFVARRMSRWQKSMMNEFEEILNQYHII